MPLHICACVSFSSPTNFSSVYRLPHVFKLPGALLLPADVASLMKLLPVAKPNSSVVVPLGSPNSHLADCPTVTLSCYSAQ